MRRASESSVAVTLTLSRSKHFDMRLDDTSRSEAAAYDVIDVDDDRGPFPIWRVPLLPGGQIVINRVAIRLIRDDSSTPSERYSTETSGLDSIAATIPPSDESRRVGVIDPT
jgi:hypothetical protein